MRDIAIRGRNGEPGLTVHHVRPEEDDGLAEPIMRLANESWHARLGHALSAGAIDAKTSPNLADNVRRVRDGIAGLTRPAAKYVVAVDDSTGDLVGLARVERYTPRNRFKRGYPNVTDVEARPPMSQRNLATAATLYFALGDYDSKDAVSLYSEEANEEGNAWFESLGMRPTGLKPEEVLTEDDTITYVQYRIERPGVMPVRSALLEQFDQLRYY